MLKLLLIGHFLADFFLQSSNMAQNKKKKMKYLFIHSFIYFLVFAIISFAFLKVQYAIWAILIISGSHLLIDLIRTKIENKYSNHKVYFFSFLIDQILHLTTIFVTYYLLNLTEKVNSIYGHCVSFKYFTKISAYCLLFVVLLNPTGVLIKKVFSYLFKEEIDNTSGNKAGSTIGKLERIITAILLLCNQYGVIGLVLTAKSIARFKQLEDKDFAERYLIGTLLSVLISLVVTIALKHFCLL